MHKKDDNKMRQILALLLTVTLVFSLAACGNAGGADAPENTGNVSDNKTGETPSDADDADAPETPNASAGAENDKTSTETDDAGVPENTGITLIDHIGREVTLAKAAETIVSCYYISTTTLIALGAEDQLTGVEMKAEEREIYKLAAPSVLELPAMGNKKNFNLEECAKLNPELVVLPMGLKDYASQLEELEITAVVVNPENMESFLDMVTMLGKASGHEETAESLLSYYDKIQEDVAEKLGEINVLKHVYFASGDDVLRSATSEMFQNEVVTAAGGEAIFSDLTGNGWTEISAEQLHIFDPEYIFMENHSEEKVAEVLGDSAYAALTAVAEGNVYAFPSEIETWDTPGASSVLGILWMSSVLYPEKIRMEEVVEEAAAFYQKFFDIEVTAEQLGL